MQKPVAMLERAGLVHHGHHQGPRVLHLGRGEHHHDLRPGGHVSYHMTGPEGDQHKGYWRVLEVEPPHRLAFEDGFADDVGEPNDDLPTSRSEVRIGALDDGRTRMTITSTYDSAADLEKVLAMGMEEGVRTAVGQIDALLAED